MEDVEGIPWYSNPKDELRYKKLTNGVHLFMPFLGPICCLYKIQYRLPKISVNFRVLMMHITRCILDAGLGREPYKIKNHLLEANRNVIKCKDIRKAPSYPTLGPSPIKDLLVMVTEADMLMQSLDPGRISEFAKLFTFRIS